MMNTYMKGVIRVMCGKCGAEHDAEYEVRQEIPSGAYGLNTLNRCKCGSQCHIEVWAALNSVTCPFCLGHGSIRERQDDGHTTHEFCEACDGNGWIERDELEREIQAREKGLWA